MLVIPAAAQDQNVQAYPSAEIDSRLATLRNDVTAEIDAKLSAIKSFLEADLDKKLDAYKSSVMTDTDKKLDALKSNLQASTYSQKAIDDKLSAIATDTSNKVNDLGQREEAEIKALDGKIPSAPWWGGAVLGAIFGALASFAVARYSAGLLDAQRRMDAADTLIDEYITISDKAAAARDLLKNPNKIGTDTDKNVIINVGNWYERVADKWLNNRADPAILESNNFTEILLEFWNSVEALKKAEPPTNLSEQQLGWPALDSFWKRHRAGGAAV
jgi:hypothetical protein